MSDGFCCITSTDEPMDEHGFCLTHPNYPAIPPSWGKRGQKFVDGDWQPSIPKPAGYQYKPRFAVPTATPQTKVAAS